MRHVFHIVICICMLSVVVALAQGGHLGSASGPTSNLARITGTVRDAQSLLAVPGLKVLLLGGAGNGVRRATTDELGRFEFHDVTTGRFRLLTDGSREFLESSYGSSSPGATGRSVEVREGASLTDLIVKVWRYGVISGTVFDEIAAPVVGARVAAYRRVYEDGMARYVLAEPAAVTDDQGRYRITMLGTGSFVVAVPATLLSVPTSLSRLYFRSAPANPDGLEREIRRSGGPSPRDLGLWVDGDTTIQIETRTGMPIVNPPAVADGRLMTYSTTFHPSGADLHQARLIEVGAGSDISSVDIQLTPLPGNRLMGRTVSTDAVPAANVVVQLVRRTLVPIKPIDDVRAAVTVSDASGSFVLPSVPQGDYLLTAVKLDSAPADAGALIAQFMVTVGDSPGILPDVRLSPAPRLRGHVIFDRKSVSPVSVADQLKQVSIGVSRLDGESSRFLPGSVMLSADGSFVTSPLLPGKFSVTATVNSKEMALQSVQLAGVDITGSAIDIRQDVNDLVVTISDRTTRLTGTVMPASGVDRHVVVAFPSELAGWTEGGMNPLQFRRVVVNEDGSYSMLGLPPGRFLVAALDEAWPVDPYDPAILKVLAPRANEVTLELGQNTTEGLRTWSGAVGALTRRTTNSAIHYLLPPPLFETLPVQESTGVAVSPQKSLKLSGVVLDASTKAPVRRATVVVAGNGLPGQRAAAITNDLGQFSFAGIPDGRVTIEASRSGFVALHYGSSRPGKGPGRPIEITEVPVELTLPMTPAASVSGIVHAASGRPAFRSQVFLLRSASRRESSEGAIPEKSTFTDDRGAYRFTGIAPGKYYLACAATAFEAGEGTGLGTTYYPSTLDSAAAAIVELGPGQDERGLNVRLRLTTAVTVGGRVIDADGRAMSGASIQLFSESSITGVSIAENAPVVGRSGVAGNFSLANVRPGRYTVVAASDPSGTSRLWSISTLGVDSQSTSDLVLVMTPGANVTGTVAFRGTSRTDPMSAQIDLTPIGQRLSLQPLSTTVQAGGQFSFRGVPPGSYFVRASAGAKWSVESINLRGLSTEVLNAPLELSAKASDIDLTVTFTDTPAHISGILVDQDAKPVVGYVVLAFSTDPHHWNRQSSQIKAARTAANGTFQIEALPPGSYFLAVSPDLDEDATQDSAFMEAASATGMRITLRPSESKFQRLSLNRSY